MSHKQYRALQQQAAADYLVTGDKRDLLSLNKIGDTPIVTAREFLRTVKMN